MKNIIIISVLTLLLGFVCCRKEEDSLASLDEFTLTSSAISADSLLPKDFTCDGSSSSLPLKWSGIPEGTKCFALIMHHVASPTDIHWYWVLYNIPLSVSSLPKNVTDVGIFGTNSVNDRLEYAPPCSQGPGFKKYTLTIYALSEDVTINVDPSQVDRATLLEAIDGITLSSSSISVYYSRAK
jgi:Raf kinase inhibitor-like YbhB/YbcL family protein